MNLPEIVESDLCESNATTLCNEYGELIAGLSLSTPSERFTTERAPLVRQAAEEISRALGYVGHRSTH